MPVLAPLPTPPATQRRPVWGGPCGAGPQGGITQSLLGRWLSCRERFRILTIEGLRARESFSAPMEFGNLHHAAEEAHAMGNDWVAAVVAYAGKLADKYPFDRDKVEHWTDMCVAQFPRYVKAWSGHQHVVDRRPLLSEHMFDVPHKLPSGRVVRLRGKWDSVDAVNGDIWLQENKSKSSIDSTKIARTLSFDIQTMLYLLCLYAYQHDQASDDPLGAWTGNVRGVRYSVIRRSAHKTPEAMLKKIDEDMAAGRGGEWFARWTMEVTCDEVARFQRECLDPALECVCDDYEWWSYCLAKDMDPFSSVYTITGEIKKQLRQAYFPHHFSRHYRYPYGVYNALAEGGTGEVDHYMATGSSSGLSVVADLFPELATEGAKQDGTAVAVDKQTLAS